MIHLAAVSRGVADLERSVAFYSWLLGLEPQGVAGTAQFACRNGQLTLVADGAPVGITLAVAQGGYAGVDPDLIPVATSGDVVGEEAASVALDHVRLNCADLAAAVAFYRGMGLVLTWAGSGGRELCLVDDEAGSLADADWVHLSSADGYLSLSQADWLGYGVHSPASGPPRFVHVGLAVDRLDPVLSRLGDRRVPHRYVSGPLGRQAYMNDCDGDPALGFNIELIEYAQVPERSGSAAR